MKTILENRASIILYNLINSNYMQKGIMLLPSNICPIVPTTLMKARMPFEFIDISGEDFLIDVEFLLKKVSSRDNISSILISNTYGIERDWEDVFSKIKNVNNNIFIIYDKCLNIPQTKVQETIADIVLYSTGYSKYVDLSYGGYAFIQNSVKYEKSNIKFNKKEHEELTNKFYNVLKNNNKFVYKDTDWLGDASMVIDKNEYFKEIKNQLSKIKAHKNEINKIYRELINNKYQLGSDYNNWRFNVIVKNKNEVLRKIFENGLFASSHYQSLVGLFGKGKGNNATILHSKIVNLFNDFRFTKEKAYSISEIVNEYAK